MEGVKRGSGEDLACNQLGLVLSETWTVNCNTKSYDVQVVDAASEEYPVRSELAYPPTKEEVMEAMGKLKGRKAVGQEWHSP